MSLVTDLFEGKISPAAFITGAAADIKKDLALFQGLPFAPTLEEWALGALGTLLSTKLSPTLSAVIINEIKSLTGTGTPTPAPAS